MPCTEEENHQLNGNWQLAVFRVAVKNWVVTDLIEDVIKN